MACHRTSQKGFAFVGTTLLLSTLAVGLTVAAQKKTAYKFDKFKHEQTLAEERRYQLMAFSVTQSLIAAGALQFTPTSPQSPPQFAVAPLHLTPPPINYDVNLLNGSLGNPRQLVSVASNKLVIRFKEKYCRLNPSRCNDVTFEGYITYKAEFQPTSISPSNWNGNVKIYRQLGASGSDKLVDTRTNLNMVVSRIPGI